MRTITIARSDGCEDTIRTAVFATHVVISRSWSGKRVYSMATAATMLGTLIRRANLGEKDARQYLIVNDRITEA